MYVPKPVGRIDPSRLERVSTPIVDAGVTDMKFLALGNLYKMPVCVE